MAILDTERIAVQSCININPFTLTVQRPVVKTNPNGISYIDRSDTPTEIIFSNPARVVLSIKRGSDVADDEGRYSNVKAQFIITDYDTVIKKYDNFSWNGFDWEIKDVEIITVDGGIKNYQAELKKVTTGTA